MIGYEFKTYIANGREYFLYREKEIGNISFTKKDFPFPESLLELVYLDIWSLEPLIKKIDRSLRELYQTKEERCVQEVLTLLEELSHAHIYFEFLFPAFGRHAFGNLFYNFYRLPALVYVAEP